MDTSTSPSSVLDNFVPMVERAEADCVAIVGKKRDFQSLRRVIARQLHECKQLNREVLADISNDAWKTLSAACSEVEVDSDWAPLQTLECLLNEHLDVCLCENHSAFVRRKSFVMLKQLLDLISSRLLLISSQDETDQSAGPREPQHRSEEQTQPQNDNVMVSVQTNCPPPMDNDPLSNVDTRDFSEESSLSGNNDVTVSVQRECLPPMDVDPVSFEDSQVILPMAIDPLSCEEAQDKPPMEVDPFSCEDAQDAPLMDIDPLRNEDVRLQSVVTVNSECNNGDSLTTSDNAVVALQSHLPQNAVALATTDSQQVRGRELCIPLLASGSTVQQDAFFVNRVTFNSGAKAFANRATPEICTNSIYHIPPEFNRNSLMFGTYTQMYPSTTSLPKGTGRGYFVPYAAAVGVSNPYVAPTPTLLPQNAQMFIPSKTDKSLSVIAREDRAPTLAKTLNGRLETLVTFRSNTQDIPIDNVSILSRLNEWDPFWSNVSIGKIGATRLIDYSYPWTDMIATAGGFRLDTSTLSPIVVSGKQISSRHWVNDEYAILLRMIPLDDEKNAKRRADCHIWPKGTFLQIDGAPISLIQRRQLRHNPKEWTGISEGLNISPLIQNASLLSTIDIFCYDNRTYVYCASLSQYRSVDHMFWRLMKGESQERITLVSLDESKRRAVFFAQSLVSIDIDDDDCCTTTDDQGKFIVSLKCPISKSVMQVPVRGRNCSHWQCFDLRSYLSINSFSSANRWRCACCDLFVSVKQLEVCGLMQQFLQEFRSSVTWNRDTVEFRSDGTYEFLAPRKVRRFKVAPEIAIKLGANETNPSDTVDIDDFEPI